MMPMGVTNFFLLGVEVYCTGGNLFLKLETGNWKSFIKPMATEVIDLMGKSHTVVLLNGCGVKLLSKLLFLCL